MNIPADLRYSPEHEWVRVDGDNATIGITDFAQDGLGDVVFVDDIELGATVDAGGSITEIESTKSVSDIYAPVSGEIVAVNSALADQPDLLNNDPYGEGWICAVAMSDRTELDNLLDADKYRELTEGAT